MKKKSILKRLLAVGTTVAMVVGTISFSVFADTAQSDANGKIGYRVAPGSPWESDWVSGFDVYGIKSDGSQIQTTYRNAGFGTVMKVGDNASIDFSGFAYGKEYTSGDVTASIAAVIDPADGSEVHINYSLHNSSNDTVTVQIGSYGDCQIGSNDSAPINLTSSGMVMSDGTNDFYVIPGAGDNSFTTRWIGGFSSAKTNVFANSSGTSLTGVDSGLAWSWTIQIPAGGDVTKTAIIGAGESVTCTLSFNANGGNGTMGSISTVPNSTETIPSNQFTREGYTFKGWTTTEGSTTVDYEDGAQITLTADTTLYAVWEEDAPAETTTEATTTTTTEATTTTTTEATTTVAETTVPTTVAEETTTTVAPATYTFIEGGGTWTMGSTLGLSFRASRSESDELTFSNFVGVRVDGIDVGPDRFDAVAGSVIVTLKPDYLQALGPGEHTITLTFRDGDPITTSFVIKAASATVSTGEKASAMPMIGCLLLVTGGMVALGVYKRKQSEKS